MGTIGQPWIVRIAPVAEGLSELLAEHGLIDGENKFTASEIAQRCALTPAEVGKVLANPNNGLAGKIVNPLGCGRLRVERVKAEGRTWAKVSEVAAA